MYSRIRNLREDKDMTQKQIGDMLNMSQTGYNQYEIGKNDIPTKILIQLAKANKLLLILPLSLALEIFPLFAVIFSLPAKSTKINFPKL